MVPIDISKEYNLISFKQKVERKHGEIYIENIYDRLGFEFFKNKIHMSHMILLHMRSLHENVHNHE